MDDEREKKRERKEERKRERKTPTHLRQVALGSRVRDNASRRVVPRHDEEVAPASKDRDEVVAAHRVDGVRACYYYCFS